MNLPCNIYYLACSAGVRGLEFTNASEIKDNGIIQGSVVKFKTPALTTGSIRRTPGVDPVPAVSFSHFTL